MPANFKIFGNHDENTILQMQNCLDAVPDSRGVLCADGHLGYAQPVGGVVAYKDHISISGVGYDIACGNMAAKTNMRYGDIKGMLHSVMTEIEQKISFGIGRSNQQKIDWSLIEGDFHDIFDREEWWAIPSHISKQQAEAQLGTVGSGNHYVDIFMDDEQFIWVGVHFGSRGLGHKTASHYLAQAGGKDGMMVAPAVVAADSDLGNAYLTAMHLVGDYAYAGREWVTRFIVRDILGCKITDEVHNHHNFAWREKHYGEDYWVVRKGATPAFPGQRGFVGGSMGDDAVIIHGVDSEVSKAAMYSTVHGAGRVMSRTQAKGKKNQPGLVNREDMNMWLANKGVILKGADLDEAPQAYRRLTDVLAYHAETVVVETVLHPIGVVMAGRDVVDPFKD